MKNMYPVLAILLALVVGVSYFIFMVYNVQDKKWDAATNFVTTILSIIIGAMISIIIYNAQQKNQSKQELLELRKNLEAEMSDIRRVLSSNEVITVNGLPFLTTFIEPIIIDECAKSGLFDSMDVENFLHISRKIKFYNVQVTYFLSILTNMNTPSGPQLLINCNKNMETSRQAILKDIIAIRDKLDLHLSDSINYQ